MAASERQVADISSNNDASTSDGRCDAYWCGLGDGGKSTNPLHWSVMYQPLLSTHAVPYHPMCTGMEQCVALKINQATRNRFRRRKAGTMCVGPHFGGAEKRKW